MCISSSFAGALSLLLACLYLGVTVVLILSLFFSHSLTLISLLLTDSHLSVSLQSSKKIAGYAIGCVSGLLYCTSRIPQIIKNVSLNVSFLSLPFLFFFSLPFSLCFSFPLSFSISIAFSLFLSLFLSHSLPLPLSLSLFHSLFSLFPSLPFSLTRTSHKRCFLCPFSSSASRRMGSRLPCSAWPSWETLPMPSACSSLCVEWSLLACSLVEEALKNADWEGAGGG